ncbi:hypothetical protein BD410DRAFT_846443 [Rickenella mellea]|uniref:Uncharacterized protein n=1 Tax=Rickenella mellea TaxID=50990 RepID=A0A4Y7PF06_9AGAM|nr:hypothetical protein BD410DRAFT_846443 [Rickenella mellea]
MSLVRSFHSHRSAKYHPYYRQLPVIRQVESAQTTQERYIASHDPPAALLEQLHRELRQAEREGKLLTYDVDQQRWTEWFRPMHNFKSGPREMAAQGFKKLPDSALPLCPHAANLFRTRSTCIMQPHRQTVQGVTEWRFRNKEHNCMFSMRIPHVEQKKKQWILAEDFNIDAQDVEPVASTFSNV